MSTNDNTPNDQKMSRDELASAYDDLLRNFTDPGASASASSSSPRAQTPAKAPQTKPATTSRAVRADKPSADSAAFAEQISSSAPQASQPRKQAPAKKAATTTAKNDAKKTKASSKKRKKMLYKEKKRKFRKQRIAHTLLSLLVSAMLIVIIVLTSSALKIPLMGMVNDIIAIDRSDNPVAVYISADMKTDQILTMLEEQDLIYSADFCKLLMGFLGYSDETEYLEGEHVLSAKMGVEGMLNAMLSDTGDATVKITFPEGYTIDQIAEKLYDAKVISAKNALYNAVATYEFPEEFDFLNSITDADTRYRVLEGYLYPDTYEFYVDENVNSVLNRFLNNFDSKWTKSYQEDADALGYSVDEIITIASILQKEANDANQMYTIASVIYNRLDSDSLNLLQCDSTQDYIANIDDGLLSQSELTELLALYDTYQCKDLPLGPICNPGGDAIYAALHPDETSYYYFCHDPEGNIYCARTMDEHAVNVQKYVK